MAGVAGRQVGRRGPGTASPSLLLSRHYWPQPRWQGETGETGETAAGGPELGPAARLCGAAGSGQMCRSRQDIHISAFLLESCCPAVPPVTVFPEMLSLATGQQNPALGHSGEILYTCKLKCFMQYD